MTEQDQGQTPAQWLLVQFDLADPVFPQVYDEYSRQYVSPECIQPMLTLKGDANTAYPMRASWSDYLDPRGRCL